MDTCLKKADWAGLAARRAEAQAKGKLRGIGMCYYIESTMGDPTEHAAIEFGDDGIVYVLVGTQTNGQGHDTAYAQVLHSRLNVPFEKIRIVQGDTDRIKAGGGTGGSRSLTAQGMAINDASDLVIERGKTFAAQVFETAPADIQFSDGTFRVAGTDRAIEHHGAGGQGADDGRRAWAWRAGSTPPPPPSSAPGPSRTAATSPRSRSIPTPASSTSSTTTSSTISAWC